MSAPPIADLMQCGCPWLVHRLGCWMAEAEAIADEAADAAKLYVPPQHRTVAALTALAEAGHLREIGGTGELIELLDRLVEAGLLGPAEEGER